MPIISDIAVKIRAITAPFTNGLEAAAKKVKGFSSGLSSAFGGVTSIVSGLGSVLSGAVSIIGNITGMIVDLGKKAALAAAGVAAVFTAIAVKAVTAAGSLESLNSQFSVLLKSQEKANQRMEELVKFAAETPFQINDIAKANKVLQSLTGGLLASADGMRVVGDAAAFAARPIDEIAVQIGRLYSGIQSGTAVGEPIARLRELGIVAGDTGQRIADMIKAGMKGEEVWKIAAKDLKRFEGTMKAMSKTTEGLISTMKDNFNLVFAEIGKGLLPVVKFAVIKLNDAFIRLKQNLKGFKQVVKEKVIAAFATIGPAVLQTASTISTIWKKLSEWLGSKNTNGWMATFGDGLFNIAASVEFVANNIQEVWAVAMDGMLMTTRLAVRKYLDSIINGFTFMMNIIPNLMQKMKDMNKELSFEKRMKNMKKSIEDAWDDFGKWVKPAKKDVDDIVNRMKKLNMERKKFVGKQRLKFDNQIKDLILELEGFFNNDDAGKKFGENVANNVEEAISKVKLEPKLALRGSQEAARISAQSQTHEMKIEDNTKKTAKATEMMAKMMQALVNNSTFQAAGGLQAVNVFDPAQAGAAVVGQLGGVQ